MVNLFISYSHEDYKHLQRLRIFLSDNNCPNIQIWDDGKIGQGLVWDDVIKNNLRNSQIVLLLITQTFLNSKYINNVELKEAMEGREINKIRVIPIFVADCLLDHHPHITKLQGMPDNKRFLSTLGEFADTEYVNIVRKINKIAEEMLTDANIQKSIMQKDNKSPDANNIQTLTSNRKIFLAIPDSSTGRERRKEFLYVVMGRMQYENWSYEIVPGVNDWQALEKMDEPEKSLRLKDIIKECVFAIHILMTADELDEGFDRLQYEISKRNEENATFFSNILWLPDPENCQDLDEKLLMNPTIRGSNYENIFKLIEDKNNEKEAKIKMLRHRFSPQKKVYMFYDFDKDHDSQLRIHIKKKIEADKRIVVNISLPGLALEKDREEVKDSEGVCLFYGASNPKWFVVRQSLLTSSQVGQQKMLCIDAPDIELKFDRDVSINAFNFLLRGGDENLDKGLDQFINRLLNQ
jgi:hypothetical protein